MSLIIYEGHSQREPTTGTAVPEDRCHGEVTILSIINHRALSMIMSKTPSAIVHVSNASGMQGMLSAYVIEVYMS